MLTEKQYKRIDKLIDALERILSILEAQVNDPIYKATQSCVLYLEIKEMVNSALAERNNNVVEFKR